MRSINEYFSQSKKNSLVKEYLLSKSKPKVFSTYKPTSGCTLDDIVDWIKTYGIKREEKLGEEARPGEIIYVVGVGDINSPTHCWVSVRNCPLSTNISQSIVAKPHAQSFYWGKERVEYKISFEEAINKMEKVLKNKEAVL